MPDELDPLDLLQRIEDLEREIAIRDGYLAILRVTYGPNLEALPRGGILPDTRKRSLDADMRRAKKDILRKVGQYNMDTFIGDHRAGLHSYPMKHEHHCWACLAWCRRKRRELT